ncbi:class I SAM-dependent methyltransferase [bacterium]|nr:class I SAM-dependent methyltransferase [bacterium]
MGVDHSIETARTASDQGRWSAELAAPSPWPSHDIEAPLFESSREDERVEGLLIDAIAEHAPSEAKALELGSRTGTLLANLAGKEQIGRVYGITPDSTALVRTGECVRRLGVAEKVFLLKGVLDDPPVEFQHGMNVVLVQEALRSLPAREHPALLQAAFQALESGGRFYGRFDSVMIRSSNESNFFSKPASCVTADQFSELTFSPHRSGVAQFLYSWARLSDILSGGREDELIPNHRISRGEIRQYLQEIGFAQVRSHPGEQWPGTGDLVGRSIRSAARECLTQGERDGRRFQLLEQFTRKHLYCEETGARTRIGEFVEARKRSYPLCGGSSIESVDFLFPYQVFTGIKP